MSVVIGSRSEGVGTGVSRVNVVALMTLFASVLVGILGLMATGNPATLAAMILIGLVLMQSPRIARQWERAVVLKLG